MSGGAIVQTPKSGGQEGGKGGQVISSGGPNLAAQIVGKLTGEKELEAGG
jgi:hypothetical protein